MTTSTDIHYSFKVLDVLLEDGKELAAVSDYRKTLASLVSRYLSVASLQTGTDFEALRERFDKAADGAPLEREFLEEALREVRKRSSALIDHHTAVPAFRRPSRKREEPLDRTARPLKTLIVEDVLIVRILLDQYLMPYGNRDMSIDGREGLLLFLLALENGTPYDLVCLDIMMPRMDGHEFLSLIRKCELDFDIPFTKSSKVIMTTALSDSKNIFSSFRAGSEGYLVKPVVANELLTLMKQLDLVKEEGE